jgi:hypothetical protein
MNLYLLYMKEITGAVCFSILSVFEYFGSVFSRTRPHCAKHTGKLYMYYNCIIFIMFVLTCRAVLYSTRFLFYAFLTNYKI